MALPPRADVRMPGRRHTCSPAHPEPLTKPIRVESDAVAGTEQQVSALPMAAYRSAVALDEPFRPTSGPAPAARLDTHVRSALHLLSPDRPYPGSGCAPAH